MLLQNFFDWAFPQSKSVHHFDHGNILASLMESSAASSANMVRSAHALIRKSAEVNLKLNDLQLTDTESAYRNILASIMDGIIAFDLSGKIRFINPVAEEMLKTQALKITGEHISCFFPGIFKTFFNVTAYGKARAYDIVLDDKTVINIDYKISPLSDNLSIILFHDVSRLKSREKELERALYTQKQLLTLINKVDSGIVIVDPKQEDSPVIFVSEGMTKITGYTQNDFLGKNCRFLQNDPTHKAKVGIDKDKKLHMKQAISHFKKHECVLQNYRKNGEMFYNQLQISPVFDTNNQIDYFVGIATDVTELVALRGSQEDQNSFFNTLANTAPMGLSIRNMVTHEYTFINSQYAKLLGFHQDDIIGRQPQDILPMEIARIINDDDVLVLTNSTDRVYAKDHGSTMTFKRLAMMAGIPHVITYIQTVKK